VEGDEADSKAEPKKSEKAAILSRLFNLKSNL
jgi:hypothetical protein